MTCLSCGGLVVGHKDFLDKGPVTVMKCANCGRSPGDTPRTEEEAGIRKVRSRLKAILGGRTNPYPLEEEKIGDFGSEEETWKTAPASTRKEPEVEMKKEESGKREKRRERLKILTDRFGGPYRTAKTFPGLSPGTMGNVLRGTFSMGPAQARKIERVAGLPEGWMDGDGPPEVPAFATPSLPPVAPNRTERTESASREEAPKKLFVCKIADPPEFPTVPGSAGAEGKISESGMADELLAALAANPRVLRIDVISVVLADAR